MYFPEYSEGEFQESNFLFFWSLPQSSVDLRTEVNCQRAGRVNGGNGEGDYSSIEVNKTTLNRYSMHSCCHFPRNLKAHEKHGVDLKVN